MHVEEESDGDSHTYIEKGTAIVESKSEDEKKIPAMHHEGMDRHMKDPAFGLFNNCIWYTL